MRSRSASQTWFRQNLATTGGAAFTRSIDYVGIDTYPDVPFPGVPAGGPIDLAAAMKQILDVVATRGCPSPALARPCRSGSPRTAGPPAPPVPPHNSSRR
jgi:hypothetical protein